MHNGRNGGHTWLMGATLVIGTTLWMSFRPQHPSSESDRLVTPEVLAQALSSDVPDRLTLSDDLDFFSRRLNERGPEDVLALRRIVSASLLRFQIYGREADLLRAENHLATLTDRYPTSSSVWATVASARLSRHDFPGAAHAAERSVREGGPDDEGGRLRLFDAYLATGRYEGASDLLSLPLDRYSFAYRTRAVRLKDRLGDVAGARDDMEAALAVARSYAQPPAIVAWCLVELGHLEHHSGRPHRGGLKLSGGVGARAGQSSRYRGSGPGGAGLGPRLASRRGPLPQGPDERRTPGRLRAPDRDGGGRRLGRLSCVLSTAVPGRLAGGCVDGETPSTLLGPGPRSTGRDSGRGPAIRETGFGDSPHLRGIRGPRLGPQPSGPGARGVDVDRGRADRGPARA